MSGQPTVDLAGGVRMRPWSSADVPQLLVAYRDPEVRRYAAAVPRTPADAEQELARRSGLFPTGQGVAWALDAAVATSRGHLLGGVTFALLDEGLGVGSVGYWLAPAARGRGLATQALRQGTSTVFRVLRWHRIELYHAVENSRSCALAERAGYRYEGLMREAMRYPEDGRWSDEHLHARLARDPEPL